MLCLGFVLLLFVFHALKVKYYPVYREKTTHEKIGLCYFYLHIFALLLFPLSPHYVSKHLAVVDPSALLLLWVIPETVGFNAVLTCMGINGVFGTVVACTYPLSVLEACLVIMLLRTKSFEIFGITRKYREGLGVIMPMV